MDAPAIQSISVGIYRAGESFTRRYGELERHDLRDSVCDQSKDKLFEHRHSVRIKASPGTKFHYSNVGTNLIGHILENVYNRTFGELLQTTVFDHADMQRTKRHLDAEEQERLANGYNGRGELIPHLAIADVLWGVDGNMC